LSDRTGRAGLPDRIAALGLVPDILINNAGLSTLGTIAKSVPEQELNLVEVDVAAVAAFGPLPGQAAYGAAKAFVLAYTHSLRGELRGTGVSATALCPGPMDTGFGEAAGFSREEAESALPRVMWIPSDKVAQAGIDGLAAILIRNHPAMKRDQQRD